MALEPVPGMWWCTFASQEAGQRVFITKEEPVLDCYQTLVYLRADEHLIVVSVDRFQLFWKYYYPKEGERVVVPDWKEIQRLDAISSGRDTPEADSGSEPSTPHPTE